MHDDHHLLTGHEFAALLRCHYKTLSAMHRAGKVPAPIQRGANNLWRRSEVLAWIEAGCPLRAEWERQRAAAVSGTV